MECWESSTTWTFGSQQLSVHMLSSFSKSIHHCKGLNLPVNNRLCPHQSVFFIFISLMSHIWFHLHCEPRHCGLISKPYYRCTCDSHLFFQLKWNFPTSNAASFLISFLKTHSYRPNLWSMSCPLYYFYSHFAIFCLFSHYCTDFSTLPSFYLLSCLTGRPVCSPTLSIKQFHKYCFKNCCINNMIT